MRRPARVLERSPNHWLAEGGRAASPSSPEEVQRRQDAQKDQAWRRRRRPWARVVAASAGSPRATQAGRGSAIGLMQAKLAPPDVQRCYWKKEFPSDVSASAALEFGEQTYTCTAKL